MPRHECHTDPARRRYTDPAGQRGFLAGLSLLAQARVHQLRRARRSNRDHAQRTRRAPALDHRTAGGIVAGVLFVLPSLFILIALSWIYIAYGHVPAVAGLFYGIKPAVTAIVALAAHRIGSRVLKNNLVWAVAAAAFVAIFAFDAPFP